MEVQIIEECGYDEALLGLGLSHGITSNIAFEDLDPKMRERLQRIAKKLSPLDGGHNKFLESICVWLDVIAPRFFWSQFDTYRVGITKQSESTMHTLLHGNIKQSDFEDNIPGVFLDYLNQIREEHNLDLLKSCLPEGFLQRRIINTNYKTLKNIIEQRKHHKLKQWHVFFEEIHKQIKHPEFIFRDE
jgi:hypothetical protein